MWRDLENCSNIFMLKEWRRPMVYCQRIAIYFHPAYSSSPTIERTMYWWEMTTKEEQKEVRICSSMDSFARKLGNTSRSTSKGRTFPVSQSSMHPLERWKLNISLFASTGCPGI